MLIDTDDFVTQRIAEDEILEPEKTALIIIDMMNRFCNPVWLAQGNHQKAEWFARELDYAIPNVTQALHMFRAAGALVVHAVCARWTLDKRDAPLHMRERDYDLFDTPAMSVIDQLAPLPGELLVRKTTGSVFTGTGTRISAAQRRHRKPGAVRPVRQRLRLLFPDSKQGTQLQEAALAGGLHPLWQ